ncbi:uncharacterized protein TNCV_2740281 [Trichonephila clavipes]|nr:uncharacterized protein TNCV_2740281 [Trichonephila clavipes]
MSHNNKSCSRKRKCTGNQYTNKRSSVCSSVDTQAKNDTPAASNIRLKTASASKLEDLKDNVLEKSSGNCNEIFGHRIFDVTTLLSVLAVLCCPVCLHDELSLTEDSRRFQRVLKSPTWSQNWPPKMMPTWLYRQDFTKFSLNRNYNNGYVNKQNCRIWSEVNPQVYVETPLHPEKLTVWCALWAGGIIGPYFFKNDEGHNVTVNGDRYRAMITNFFIPELNNHDVQELWFQQDDATCHTARATIDLLKDIFTFWTCELASKIL